MYRGPGPARHRRFNMYSVMGSIGTSARNGLRRRRSRPMGGRPYGAGVR